MEGSERRRAERHPVDLGGTLLLSDARRVKVRIVNIGTLGALLKVTDLEEPIFEGERAVLDHPLFVDGRPQARRAESRGYVVRVEMDFADQGVSRALAVYFDGGPLPDGIQRDDVPRDDHVA
jgi:hypothetical protein